MTHAVLYNLYDISIFRIKNSEIYHLQKSHINNIDYSDHISLLRNRISIVAFPRDANYR